MYTPGRSELTTEDRYEIRGLGSSFLEETKRLSPFSKRIEEAILCERSPPCGAVDKTLENRHVLGCGQKCFRQPVLMSCLFV